MEDIAIEVCSWPEAVVFNASGDVRFQVLS